MVKFFVTGSRKKRIVFLLSLFQLACYCNAQISTFVPIKDNVAWFPFNSSISDSSGKGNHLTNYNGVKAINDRFGVANNARYFNGTNQDLKSSHSSSLTISSDLTLCAWILDSNTNSKYQTIIAKRQSGFWNYALTISHDTLITKKGRNKVVTSRRNVGPVVDFKFSLDTIPLNRWVHVAVAVKSDTVRFYLDGREISCLVDSNILFPKSFGKVFSIPAKDPLGGLSVGSDNDGGEFFKGRLDDVGIWRRALTVCEIRALSKSKAWIDLKPFHGFVYRKCGIDSLAMNAVSGMKTYLWSVGSTKQKLIVKKSGKYSVLMNDSFGCEYRDTITVVFSNPKFSFSSDSLLLKNCKRDSLRVSVGSKWKSVVWSHGKKDSVVFLKNSGFYSVLLTDTNDCKVSDTTYFGNPGKVDLVLLSIDSVKCNAGNTGRIVTSLFGGFVPLKLKWNDPLGQTTPTVVDLSAGNYRGILQDRFGCSDTLDAIVGQPKLLYATVAATDSVNCFGGKDGRAFVSVTGGISPYTYKWNDPLGQAGSLAVGLKAGGYSVIIKDAKGCTTNANGTVHQPGKMVLSILKVDSVRCFGESNGKIAMKIVGGNGVNSYFWSDLKKQRTLDADSLSIGLYRLKALDQYNCSDSISTSVFGPTLLKINFQSMDSAKCFGDNSGKLKVFSSGGNGGDFIVWNDPLKQKQFQATSLKAGSYKAIVIDKKGCKDSIFLSVLEPSKILVSLIAHDSANCYLSKDGSLEVSSVGGTGWRKYQWNDNLNQTTTRASNLSAGVYRLRVYDQYGCADTQYYNVLQPAPLDLIVDGLDSVTCFNGVDGKLTIRGIGGSGAYQYFWMDSVNRKSRFAYGLSSKKYKSYVIDFHGCKDSLEFVMPQPMQLKASVRFTDSVNCFGGSDGRVFTMTSGGNGGFKYQWDDPYRQKLDSAIFLKKGKYKMIVNDIYQCRDSLIAEVFEPAKVSMSIVKVDSVSCFKFSDGKILVNSFGGTGFYKYFWSSNPPQYTALATGLSAGFYRVWVTDNYGCSDSSSAMVYEPDSITLEIMGGIHTMKGSKIQLTSVAMPIQPYFYSWEPKSIFGNQWNLKEPNVIIPNSGIVKLTITNLKGCPLSDTAYIKVVLPPKEFMPTGFTPNGDGLNQGFGVPDIFETVSFIIYDRWGGKVFSGDNNHPRWDGTINGELASPGVYVYMFEAILKGTNQRISYGGSVTLIR